MKLPGAIVAYRWLCIWVAIAQAGLVWGGIKLTQYVPPADVNLAPDPQLVKLMPMLGWILIPLAMATMFASLVFGMAKPKPWLWIAGLSHIIGSIIFCPMAFLLLIPWYTIEVKRYFDPEGNVIT